MWYTEETWNEEVAKKAEQFRKLIEILIVYIIKTTSIHFYLTQLNLFTISFKSFSKIMETEFVC
jgi:hypothetical protein